MIIGIVLVAFFAALDPMDPPCYDDDIDLETHQLGRKLGSPIGLSLGISVLDSRYSVLLCSQARAEPAEFPQRERTQSCIDRRKVPYARDFLRLLRLDRNAHTLRMRKDSDNPHHFRFWILDFGL